jgi:hypothetical protein
MGDSQLLDLLGSQTLNPSISGMNGEFQRVLFKPLAQGLGYSSKSGSAWRLLPVAASFVRREWSIQDQLVECDQARQWRREQGAEDLGWVPTFLMVDTYDNFS